jgi:hypothetical protein
MHPCMNQQRPWGWSWGKGFIRYRKRVLEEFEGWFRLSLRWTYLEGIRQRPPRSIAPAGDIFEGIRGIRFTRHLPTIQTKGCLLLAGALNPHADVGPQWPLSGLEDIPFLLDGDVWRVLNQWRLKDWQFLFSLSSNLTLGLGSYHLCSKESPCVWRCTKHMYIHTHMPVRSRKEHRGSVSLSGKSRPGSCCAADLRPGRESDFNLHSGVRWMSKKEKREPFCLR